MSLQDQVLKVLSDNINRTPKEIYKQIITDKDYFFTVMNPETSIKNLCLRMYKKELIECQVKDNILHYYIPLPPEREEISEEEEKQKIVEYIVYYEEERNKIASEQKIKKNQYRNTVIIFILSLVAFGFNYYN
jgi:predicted transcriptional regulator|tara:strand:+ start:181 stop:579 length:399 start_codon:yes stop_codon:yes gene_type:complete